MSKWTWNVLCGWGPAWTLMMAIGRSTRGMRAAWRIVAPCVVAFVLCVDTAWGADGSGVVVSLTTPNTPEKTAEPCPLCRIAPGEIIVQRTGPTTDPLVVGISTDGTATPGVDYEALPATVTIPAGTNATTIGIFAWDDALSEGPEVVRVRLQPAAEGANAGYDIDPEARTAMVVIADSDPSASGSRLDILQPADGASYPAGSSIPLEVLGVATDGEIGGVEFYADDVLIGTSVPPLTERPTIPCLPTARSFVWVNPPPGRHTITAQGQISLREWASAPPVVVTVASEPVLPVVRIDATEPVAEETSAPLRRLALRGGFTVTRTGSTADPLSLFVHYSGLATPGTDYPAQPFLVTIPAGTNATHLEIVPTPDEIPEGIETVVATLSHCPPDTDPPLGMPCVLNSEIDPVHDHATVFIREDGVTEATLHLTQPAGGAEFEAGVQFHLEANAIDLKSYIGRVDFLDGEVKIGTSEILFVKPPDPGTVLTHSITAKISTPGEHVLTARAVRTDGTPVLSEKVAIKILASPPQPLLEFQAPERNAVYSSLEEIPIRLRAFAPGDVFPGAEVLANGGKIAEVSYCCWLCPCAVPLPGFETVLQIPVRPPTGVPSRPWQGWVSGHAGLYEFTARATGTGGTEVHAGPVRVLVYDPTLRISVGADGTTHLAIPEGSLAPGQYDLEVSTDLAQWTTLGSFEAGNVAAFYTDPPPPKPGARRFYRSVFHPALLP